MDNYDNILDWKNHNPFYYNLNKDLDELKQISKSVKDLKYCQTYYDILENFSMHYYSYLDMDEIDKKLQSAAKIIYTTQFDIFLKKQLKNLDNKQNRQYFDKILNTLKTLKEVHRLIIQGLFDNGLLPKVTKVKKKKAGDAVKGSTY